MALIASIPTVVVAFINMVGSVAILWIRAAYNYRDVISDGKNGNGVRNVPDPTGTTHVK